MKKYFNELNQEEIRRVLEKNELLFDGLSQYLYEDYENYPDFEEVYDYILDNFYLYENYYINVDKKGNTDYILYKDIKYTKSFE